MIVHCTYANVALQHQIASLFRLENPPREDCAGVFTRKGNAYPSLFDVDILKKHAIQQPYTAHIRRP
jgi:hypothetical protein